MSSVPLETAVPAMLSGLGTHFKDTDSLKLGGETVKVKDLKALLEENIALTKTVASAEAKVKTTRATLKESNKVVRTRRASLHRVLLGQHGEGSAILVDFGFVKKPKKSVETKAQAVVKSRETRKLLGTKGKRQKQDALKQAANDAAAAAKNGAAKGETSDGATNGAANGTQKAQ
jgi:hypothetical protein